MELSTDTLKRLVEIQNNSILSDDIFIKLLNNVVSHTCGETDESSISKLFDSKLITAQSYLADISCLFIEATRHNLDRENLMNFLQAENVSGERIEKLCQVYAASKKEIRMQLESTGNCLPHIVDINWRLDYCIKSDVEDAIGSPKYHIRLSTKKYNDPEYMTFTCTVQQLQELLYKLKDVSRHLEKMINV